MTQAYATITGSLTDPAGKGVRASITVSPQTTDKKVRLEDGISVGPSTGLSDSSGTLRSYDGSDQLQDGIKVPIVDGILWTLEVDYVHGYGVFATGYTESNLEITADTDLSALTSVENVPVTPEAVQEAQAAAAAAAASAAEAQDILDQINAGTPVTEAQVDTIAQGIVDAEIAALVGTAPADLNTLQEIAAALAGDETTLSALNTALASKADASALVGLASVTYVDGQIATRATTSALTSLSTTVAAKADKTYVDDQIAAIDTSGGGVALGETDTTAYRGDRGKIAYDHSQSTGNPHGTTYAQITGTPTLATVATSGLYADLGSKPALSTVATTGAYTDLTGKPALSTVATTGAYTDLSAKPTLGTAAAAAATDFATAAQGTEADTAVQPGDLATVATSGAYADLSGLPTLASDAYAPETHGAIGDGVVNDLSALQAAIDALSAAGGGRLKLANGKRYAFNGLLIIKPGVMLEGTATRQADALAAAPAISGLVATGAGAQLRVGNWLSTHASGIRNLYVDGNYTGGVAASVSDGKAGLVRITGVNVLIDNLFCVRSAGDGIVYDGTQNSTIVGCYSIGHVGAATVYDNGPGALAHLGGYYGSSKGGAMIMRNTSGETDIYPYGPYQNTWTGTIFEAYDTVTGPAAPPNDYHVHISGGSNVFVNCNFTGGAANATNCGVLIDNTVSTIADSTQFHSCTWWTYTNHDAVRITGAGSSVFFTGYQQVADDNTHHALSFVCMDGVSAHVSIEGEVLMNGVTNGSKTFRLINGGDVVTAFNYHDTGTINRLRANQVTGWRHEDDTVHRGFISRDFQFNWYDGAVATLRARMGIHPTGTGLQFDTGVVRFAGGTEQYGKQVVQAASYVFADGTGTTYTCDASTGPVKRFSWVSGGTNTIAFSGAEAGIELELMLAVGATSPTITWPATASFTTGFGPSLPTNTTSRIRFRYDEVAAKWIELSRTGTSGGTGSSPTGLPSYVTSATNRYDPAMTVYNLKGSNTRKTRAGLARAMLGGKMDIVCIGDSSMIGYNGSGQHGSKELYAAPRYWGKTIAQQLGVREAGSGLVCPASSASIFYEDRFTVTGTVTYASGGTTMSAGSTITFSPMQIGTIAEVYYSNLSGAFTVQIDGGSAVPVTPSGASTMSRYQVTGLTDGAHTIKVNSTATTYLGAMAIQRASGVALHNLCWGGGKVNLGGPSLAWLDTSTAANVQAFRKGSFDQSGISPDTFLICLGANDLVLGDTFSNFSTGYTTIRNWYPSADIFMFVTCGLASLGQTAWETWVNQMYGLADSLGAVLFDQMDAMGFATQANTNGLIGVDGAHETWGASMNWGRAMARTLVGGSGGSVYVAPTGTVAAADQPDGTVLLEV